MAHPSVFSPKLETEPANGLAAKDLLARYDRPGPRYTSYPAAHVFHEGFGAADYEARLARADRFTSRPLSLYFHLPFCRQRCLFCGCHAFATQHLEVAERYLDELIQEIDLVAERLPRRRQVSQLHWGGGTPTYYSMAGLERLFRAIAARFILTTEAEVGVEADPRVTSTAQVARLAHLGFNRISLGVQDFSPMVQAAVGREQSFFQTAELVDAARDLGFQSVNLDLIYGLPFQTPESFRETLRRVTRLAPDRVAVYSFAFVPWLKPHQRRLPVDALPDAAGKAALFRVAHEELVDAGYRAIGMDHYALPWDELDRAQRQGTLHRNFMGYTVQTARDLVGFGVSAIGDVQGAFAQNAKKLSTYGSAVRAGCLPTERGYARGVEDERRGHVIRELMCNLRLEIADWERRFRLDFYDHFAPELARLRGPGSPEEDGLVEIQPDRLTVTERGRLLVRSICMTFDATLNEREDLEVPRFSRTV